MMDDDEPTRALIRLEAKLEALEELRAEIEPWRMEERDESAREALDNVIAQLPPEEQRAAPGAPEPEAPAGEPQSES